MLLVLILVIIVGVLLLNGMNNDLWHWGQSMRDYAKDAERYRERKAQQAKRASGALVECPDCQHDVSIEAHSCPHCGRPGPFERDPRSKELDAAIGRLTQKGYTLVSHDYTAGTAQLRNVNEVISIEFQGDGCYITKRQKQKRAIPS